MVDHKRRLYLQIAALAGLVEEESLKGALETSHLANVYGESGSGNLHAKVKVHKIVLLAEIPVAKGVIAQIGFLSPLLHHHVVGGILTLGDIIVGHVGNGQQQLGHIVLSLLHLGLQFLVGGLQVGHLLLYRISFVLLAALHQTANLLRQLILLLLVGIQLLLGFATLPVKIQNLFDSLTGTIKMLLLQAFDDMFRVFAD